MFKKPNEAFLFLAKGVSILAIGGFVSFIAVQIPRHLLSPVKSVRIHGNELIDKTVIAKYLGIYEDQSWLSTDPYELSIRVKELPWIEEATVRKNLASGLDIHVSERRPVAYLKAKDRLAMICSDYLILERIDKKRGWDLPVIVHNGLDMPVSGRYLKSEDLNGAFRLMDLLRDSTVLPLDAVSEVFVDDPLNMELITIPDGIKVKLGFRNFREKLRNLELASSKIDGMRHKISIIDLRHRRGVVVTYKY